MKRCKIDINQNGNVVVKGENASVYNQALLRLGNEPDALDVYSISLTDRFKDLQLEPSVDNILNYIEQSNITSASDYTNQELRDIYNSVDYQNFLPATTINGKFGLERNNMRQFYSEQEIDNIFDNSGLQNRIQNLWYKFTNNIDSLESYDFTPNILNKTTGEVTILGKNERENPDKTYNDIGRYVAGAQTIEEAQERLTTSPDVELTEDVLSQLVQEFSNKQALQQYVINPETNSLEKKAYNSTYHRLLQTFDTSQDTSQIQEEIDFLNSIDLDVLNTNSNAFQDILARIEDYSTDIGIDMNNLSEFSEQTSVEQTMGLLNSYSEFLTTFNPTTFSETYNNFFNVTEYNRPEILEVQGENLMIIENKNQLSEIQLFNDYNIIKVKDNIYQKVNTDTLDIYEDLYNRALENPSIFPSEVYEPYDIQNKRYKSEIKANITEYIQNEAKDYQTETPYPIQSLEYLTAFKRVYGQQDTVINKEYYINNLQNEKFDIDKFVIKFNKQAIQDNLPVTFTQNGIELPYNGIYSALELRNSVNDSTWKNIVKYAMMTNNLPSVLLLEGEQYNRGLLDENFERNFYTNFKDQLPTYRQMYEQDGDKIYTNSNETFIKVKNNIYQNVAPNVYSLVQDQQGYSWNRPSPRQLKEEKTVDIRPQSAQSITKKPTKTKENIDKCKS